MTHTYSVWRINTALVSEVVREQLEQQHSMWNVALNIKCLAALQFALIVVLLITFSFAGATPGCVYCSPLHYCRVANAVAVVWPLCYVLWISIIVPCLICTEDVTGLHKYHFVKPYSMQSYLQYIHFSPIDVILRHDRQGRWEIMFIFIHINAPRCIGPVVAHVAAAAH